MKITKKSLVGTWRITQTEQWERDYLDMEQPAHITLKSDGLGEMAFGAMHTEIDWRLDGDQIDFTFAGVDEGTEVSGRGRAQISDAMTMAGHIFLHLGDESGFSAVKKSR